MKFNRNLDDKFNKRLSLPEDKLGLGLNVAWNADVVSIDGAHYHFWIPLHLKDLAEQRKQFLDVCKYHASWQGDPVSYSYSYLPEVLNDSVSNQV